MSTAPRPGSLELRNVIKEFASPGHQSPVRAVDGVTLTIEPGEFITLLGPSGCGKTTTLRMLAGFEFPTSGQILLDGQDITVVPPNQRQMTMVFQSYALFPHLSVFENIAYGLRLKHLRESEVREQVDIVLHLINLTGMDARSPHQLSGGQQQRVALARALVMKPKVLLFDEPLSNLDAKLRLQMRMELRRLQRRLGVTAVYVTHDQAEAMSLSDRIVVMRAGRVEQVGLPREIYAEPQTAFVADFIGRANFVPTTVEALDGDHARVSALGQTLTVPAHAGLGQGSEAYLVIRPDALQIVPTTESGAAPGEIVGAAYLGQTAEYDIEVGNQALFVVDYTPSQVHTEGAAVGLRLNQTQLRLLPRQDPT
ncbi:MAG TPA: ABC transporter ATP-binding protein [Anaerolineales bacterium]|nr:ABC transporter ATP-binding protein [Anaerolineales bacterium]